MTKHTPQMNNSDNFKQPEALRIAIKLEREWTNDALNYDTAQEAWTELRRLHKALEAEKLMADVLRRQYMSASHVNESLLEALNAAEDLLHRMGMQSSDAYQEIDAAIAKATGGVVQHWSDCAVHNEPAYPAGKCDCGGYTPSAPTIKAAGGAV